ncbi:hypothetical protein ACFQ61_32465 [Streptomyces sp. NPDC056500]|uniref:hypothetical protein n=1 Tax=Streptomyces sp. NPDC056500 TaxID=3345840 RepID=UPI0036AA128A
MHRGLAVGRVALTEGVPHLESAFSEVRPPPIQLRTLGVHAGSARSSEIGGLTARPATHIHTVSSPAADRRLIEWR